MKSDEYVQKLRHLKWLYPIADEYEKFIHLIESEKEHFTVDGIIYSARGEEEKFSLNCHRTMPNTYILEGMKRALHDVKVEIAMCEAELKQTYVEL